MKKWFKDKFHKRLFIAVSCLTLFEWFINFYWAVYGRTMHWGFNIGTITWFPDKWYSWALGIFIPVCNFFFVWLMTRKDNKN